MSVSTSLESLFDFDSDKEKPDAPVEAADLETAVAICRKFESVAPSCGCHVALTGGTLYKSGFRKDVDILFYRIRQVEDINYQLLFSLLREKFGVEVIRSFGWVTKAKMGDIDLDLFFPEDQSAPNDSGGY